MYNKLNESTQIFIDKLIFSILNGDEIKLEHETEIKKAVDYLIENKNSDNLESAKDNFIRCFNYNFRNSLLFHDFVEERAINNKEPLEHDGYCYCKDCGEPIYYTATENSIVIDNLRTPKEDCKKYRKCEAEVYFPTGELLCGDSLPNFYEIRVGLYSDISISCSKGTYQTINNCAGKNIVHVYVGNSCPSLYYNENQNKLVIGHSYCKENENEYNIETLPLGEDTEEIHSICTDLWWGSVVDIVIYKQILIDHYGEEDGLNIFNSMEDSYKVKKKIKPGVYKLTYKIQDEDARYEKDEPFSYCTLEWIREK